MAKSNKPKLVQNIIIKNIDKDTAKAIQQLQIDMNEKTASQAILKAINLYKYKNDRLTEEIDRAKYQQTVIWNVKRNVTMLNEALQNLNQIADEAN